MTAMASRKLPVRARAFAKLNLTLRVLGRRSDGYHELRTTFQSIALHDTLIVTAGEAFAIECDDPACPIDRVNLVWRAADAMWRAAGRRGAPDGVRVRLVKRVPIQAGLGGGSSDAAAALRAFAVIWNVPDAAIRAAAPALGADVPFFLQGGTALGVERGDVLFPLADWPRSWVVIVVPDFGVGTKEAYAWFDAENRSGGFSNTVRKTSRPIFPEMWNDLEPAVAAHHPEVGRLVRALRRGGASYAAMSGSGSAVFGLFETRPEADACALGLRAPGCRIIVTHTLSRGTFSTRSRPLMSRSASKPRT